MTLDQTKLNKLARLPPATAWRGTWTRLRRFTRRWQKGGKEVAGCRIRALSGTSIVPDPGLSQRLRRVIGL